MIVVRFLESLRQLTVTYIDLVRPIEPEEVRIDQNVISMGEEKIKILPEDSFQLDYDTLRLNQSQFNGTWSITMMLGAQLCKQIESCNLDKYNPPLDDLLNDWVFCHQHGDNPISIEQIKPKVTSSLETISQIKFLLRKQSMMSTVMFESENKVDNLAVRIINPKIYIGLANSGKSNVHEIELQQAAAIQYKRLSSSDNLEEVKKFRHSFKVDWYIVSDNLFDQMIETFQQNNLNKFFTAQLSEDDGFLDAFI